MSDTVPASCLQAPRAMIAAVLLVVASALGGCAGGGATGSGSYAMASAGSGSTVAFESIDGPPPQVFDRMVNVLDSESKLRNVAVVSRDGSASYRGRRLLGGQGQPGPSHDGVGVGRL